MWDFESRGFSNAADGRFRRDPADGNPSRNGSVGWKGAIPDLPGL